MSDTVTVQRDDLEEGDSVTFEVDGWGYTEEGEVLEVPPWTETVNGSKIEHTDKVKINATPDDRHLNTIHVVKLENIQHVQQVSE